jgi:2-polyprenyl-6-methoxyphenol hydroxylase-like FAD-dependent oxidoreductase
MRLYGFPEVSTARGEVGVTRPRRDGGQPLRALIVGGGPGGLATALALRSVGVDALVFEQSGQPGSRVGTGLTLWPNALAALAAFDADKPVRDVGFPAQGNQIVVPGGALLDDVPAALMRERFGGTGIALLRSELIDVLLSLLGPDVVRTSMRYQGYRAEGNRVVACFADGAEEVGDLLIGADGLRSVVRSQLHDGGERLRYAGYPVWRGVTGYPLGRAPGVLTMGRAAQFGLFPMRNNRVYWFATVPMAEGHAATLPARAVLLDRFGDWHAPIGAVLAASRPEEIVVTDIYDRPPMRRWGRGRVTLMGDAAHPSTPELGQGTCQAFEDAAVLGRCLGRHPDVAYALERYESVRRARANVMATQARRLGRLGQWGNPLACWLRAQFIRHSPRGPRMRQLGRMFTFGEE